MKRKRESNFITTKTIRYQMIETFLKETIEIVDDPKVDRMLGKHAQICHKNHSHVEVELVGCEELETDHQEKMLKECKQANDENHFCQHGAYLRGVYAKTIR